MHAQLLAIVLRVFASLGYGDHHADVALALAEAVDAAPAFDRPLLAATIAVYAIKESGLQLHPKASSWDAREGRSCGLLQLSCSFTRAHPTASDQARAWIRNVMASSLASVDSDPARAKRRLRLAHVVLLSMQ